MNSPKIDQIVFYQFFYSISTHTLPNKARKTYVSITLGMFAV